MVKYTYLYDGGQTVREYTVDQAFQSIGTRAALGFNVVARHLDGLVYFTDDEDHVWAIYEFKAV